MGLLTPDAIERIHDASLQLLETVGVKLDHPEVVAKLRQAGAEPRGERVCRRCVGGRHRDAGHGRVRSEVTDTSQPLAGSPSQSTYPE